MNKKIKEFLLTKNQKRAISFVNRFVQSDADIFVLTGAAGTGKTTVLKNIIEEVKELVEDVTILAPTNRAVKILSEKTRLQAKTVHSEIYNVEEIKKNDGKLISTSFVPKIDKLKLNSRDMNDQVKLYIIDESSMLSGTAVNEGKLISKNSILEDLYIYVKFFGLNNKIIFVGDSYQLPPIGYDGIAPALDKKYLKETFSEKIWKFELTEILRQKSGSVILKLAQDVKNKIDLGHQEMRLIIANKYSNYNLFIKNYVSILDPLLSNKLIALGWTRRSVLKMNIDIRREIHSKSPDVFEIGDLIYLNSRYKNESFVIQKGEMGRVVEIVKPDVEIGGMLFHTLKIEFTNIDNTSFVIESKVLSDYAYTHEEYIPKEMFIKLAIERAKVNKIFKNTHDSYDDEFMNAMQLKFAYALTVHKAQGGEWKNVFLHSYKNWKDLRWNYTAITRASLQLHSF